MTCASHIENGNLKLDGSNEPLWPIAATVFAERESDLGIRRFHNRINSCLLSHIKSKY